MINISSAILAFKEKRALIKVRRELQRGAFGQVRGVLDHLYWCTENSPIDYHNHLERIALQLQIIIKQDPNKVCVNLAKHLEMLNELSCRNREVSEIYTNWLSHRELITELLIKAPLFPDCMYSWLHLLNPAREYYGRASSVLLFNALIQYAHKIGYSDVAKDLFFTQKQEYKAIAQDMLSSADIFNVTIMSAGLDTLLLYSRVVKKFTGDITLKCYLAPYIGSSSEINTHNRSAYVDIGISDGKVEIYDITGTGPEQAVPTRSGYGSLLYYYSMEQVSKLVTTPELKIFGDVEQSSKTKDNERRFSFWKSLGFSIDGFKMTRQCSNNVYVGALKNNLIVNKHESQLLFSIDK